MLRATASGLEDETIIAEALATLCGDEEAVEIEKTTSYHGSPVYLVSATITKKGACNNTLASLGVDALNDIEAELEQKFDEANNIHFRLDLTDFVNGQATISQPGDKATLKGMIKVEVYPNQDPMEQAIAVISQARAKAERMESE